MPSFKRLINSIGKSAPVCLILQLATGAPAHAQLSSLTPSSATIVGGTWALPPPPPNPFAAPGTNLLPIHKDVTGRACISVHGLAQSQITNPRIFDQPVVAT